MENSTVVERAPSGLWLWCKRIFKFLGYLLLLIVFGLFLWHLSWKYSGDDQWILHGEKNGVKVYTKKQSGSTLLQYRGEVTIKYSLNHVVAAMMDTTVENCAKWLPGCFSEKSIEPWNAEELYFIHLTQINPPEPLLPREFLLKTQFSQDPQTKAILVEFIAQPDLKPRNDCCVRITHMHNKWQYTPKGNGELAVQFTQNMSLAGNLPYFMQNKIGTQGVYGLLGQLSKLMDQDKYRQARYDFVTEAE